MLGMTTEGAGINPFAKGGAASTGTGETAARGLPLTGPAPGATLGGLGAGMGISAGFGLAAALSEAFRVDGDGYVRNGLNERVCRDGRDPDERNKRYNNVGNMRRQTDALGACKGDDSGALRAAKTVAWRSYWMEKEMFKIRCFDNDDNHRPAINSAKAAYEKCRAML